LKSKEPIGVKDLLTIAFLILSVLTIIHVKYRAYINYLSEIVILTLKEVIKIAIPILLALLACSLTIIKIKLKKGTIILGFSRLIPVFIDLSRAKHIVIFGMTGSGKTETAKRIAYSSRKDKLIIDWSGEYEYGVIATPKELSLNLNTYEILDALTSAFQLTIPQQSVLLEALGEATNLKVLIDKLKKMKVKSETEKEIRNALLRRLLPLEKLNLFHGKLDLSEINTLDLSELTYEAKKLVVNLVLRMFYNSPKPGILVIEEAQNIIPRNPIGKTPSSAELIINELRKRGVCVILVAQTPSQISMAFRNADYIIIHRLQLTPKEAQILGLSNEEIEKIARLNTGECLLIRRGDKKWVRVLLSRKSIGKRLKDMYGEKNNEDNSVIAAYIDKENNEQKQTEEVNTHFENKISSQYDDLIGDIIEDLSEVLRWRRGINSRIERIEEIISKLVQDIKDIYDTMDRVKKVEPILNPASLADFITRTNEKLTQLSTAIAVLRRNNSEITRKLEKMNSNQVNASIMESLVNVNKRVNTLESKLKRQIELISKLEEKIGTLHIKLADFEKWVKEALNTIAQQP